MTRKTRHKKIGTVALSLVLTASLSSPMAVFADATPPEKNAVAQAQIDEPMSGEQNIFAQILSELLAIENNSKKAPRKLAPSNGTPSESSEPMGIKGIIDKYRDAINRIDPNLVNNIEQGTFHGLIALLDYSDTVSTMYALDPEASKSNSYDYNYKDYSLQGSMSIGNASFDTSRGKYNVDKGLQYSLDSNVSTIPVKYTLCDAVNRVGFYGQIDQNKPIDADEMIALQEKFRGINLSNLESGFIANFKINDDLKGHFDSTSVGNSSLLNGGSGDGNSIYDIDRSQENSYVSEDGRNLRIFMNLKNPASLNDFADLFKYVYNSANTLSLTTPGLVLDGPTDSSERTETNDEIITSGTIQGNLLGYMTTNVWNDYRITFLWGVDQDQDVAKEYQYNHTNDSRDVIVPIQFTEKKKIDDPTVTPDEDDDTPEPPSRDNDRPLTPRTTISVTPSTSTNKGPSTPQLDTQDHYAYITGYPDNTVHPNGNITRAEAAAVFFRLLTPSLRESEFAKIKNGNQAAAFSDVNKGSWYYTAVAVMKDMGILSGYSDGSFNPNAPITRAEFAAIAERFNKNPSGNTKEYTDIAGHWAEDQIRHAAADKWIYGYPDGTFRPNNKITRAESMAIVNRVTKRYPDAAHPFHLENDPEMHVWSDNQDKSKWYYLDVQEATNSHNYHRTGTPAERNGEKYDYNTEYWNDATQAPDWSRYNL